MSLITFFLGEHPEPPAWLYNLLARGPIARRFYRCFVDDLAGSLPAEARLLDVGTGPGYLLQLLSRKRPDLHLFGLDLDDKMIRWARRRTGLTWMVADVRSLPFSAGIFDQIIATFSLHTWREPEAGIQEIWRALKPGGRAWIYEMNQGMSLADITAFSREVGLPFLLLYPGLKLLSRQHAVPTGDFVALLQQAAAVGGQLHAAHHVFWRGELVR